MWCKNNRFVGKKKLIRVKLIDCVINISCILLFRNTFEGRKKVKLFFLEKCLKTDMPAQFDFLIAGGGIAGLMLAAALSEQSANIVVVNDENANSSSSVAAGVIRPITGRRLVKTWMADELFPYAFKYYLEKENQCGKHFFSPLPIAEIYDSVKQKNDWNARSAEAGYSQYIGNEFKDGQMGSVVKAPYGGVLLKQTAVVDSAVLLQSLKELLISRGVRFISRKFHYDDFHISERMIEFEGITARILVFAEGWKAVENPWFKNLHLLPAKGELLIIECPELKPDYILSKGINIIPCRDNLFLAGSTYEWKFKDDHPTIEAKMQIEESLRKIIAVECRVVAHKAAIRPANQQRRPVTAIHPVYKNVMAFNGLGTKGFLLAPYFAQHMAESARQVLRLNDW